MDPDGSVGISIDSGVSIDVLSAVGRIHCRSVSGGRGDASYADSQDISRPIGL